MKNDVTLNLSALVTKVAGGYAAHCLEASPYQVRTTVSDVKDALMDGLRTHVDAALPNDWGQFFHAAPLDVWQRYNRCTTGARRVARVNAGGVGVVVRVEFRREV